MVANKNALASKSSEDVKTSITAFWHSTGNYTGSTAAGWDSIPDTVYTSDPLVFDPVAKNLTRWNTCALDASYCPSGSTCQDQCAVVNYAGYPNAPTESYGNYPYGTAPGESLLQVKVKRNFCLVNKTTYKQPQYRVGTTISAVDTPNATTGEYEVDIALGDIPIFLYESTGSGFVQRDSYTIDDDTIRNALAGCAQPTTCEQYRAGTTTCVVNLSTVIPPVDFAVCSEDTHEPDDTVSQAQTRTKLTSGGSSLTGTLCSNKEDVVQEPCETGDCKTRVNDFTTFDLTAYEGDLLRYQYYAPDSASVMTSESGEVGLTIFGSDSTKRSIDLCVSLTNRACQRPPTTTAPVTLDYLIPPVPAGNLEGDGKYSGRFFSLPGNPVNRYSVKVTRVETYDQLEFYDQALTVRNQTTPVTIQMPLASGIAGYDLTRTAETWLWLSSAGDLTDIYRFRAANTNTSGNLEVTIQPAPLDAGQSVVLTARLKDAPSNGTVSTAYATQSWTIDSGTCNSTNCPPLSIKQTTATNYGNMGSYVMDRQVELSVSSPSPSGTTIRLPYKLKALFIGSGSTTPICSATAEDKLDSNPLNNDSFSNVNNNCSYAILHRSGVDNSCSTRMSYGSKPVIYEDSACQFIASNLYGCSSESDWFWLPELNYGDTLSFYLIATQGAPYIEANLFAEVADGVLSSALGSSLPTWTFADPIFAPAITCTGTDCPYNVGGYYTRLDYTSEELDGTEHLLELNFFGSPNTYELIGFRHSWDFSCP